MPHDPARIEDTRAWISRASTDLRAAQIDLAADPALCDDALFHCQQIAEKSFKAFLAWHDRPFRKTHALEEIGNQCLEMDPSLKAVVDRSVALTEYAWKFRYPGELDQPSRQEAEEGLRIARDVYEAISARIPAEARP